MAQWGKIAVCRTITGIGASDEDIREGFRVDVDRRSVAAVPPLFRCRPPRGDAGQPRPGGRAGKDRRDGRVGACLGQYAPCRGGRAVGPGREPLGAPDDQRGLRPARRGNGLADPPDGPRLLPILSDGGSRVRAEPRHGSQRPSVRYARRLHPCFRERGVPDRHSRRRNGRLRVQGIGSDGKRRRNDRGPGGQHVGRGYGWLRRAIPGSPARRLADVERATGPDRPRPGEKLRVSSGRTAGLLQRLRGERSLGKRSGIRNRLDSHGRRDRRLGSVPAREVGVERRRLRLGRL